MVRALLDFGIEEKTDLDVTGKMQHTLVGQLGWLAGKGHPELCETYRFHASAIKHWSEKLRLSPFQKFQKFGKPPYSTSFLNFLAEVFHENNVVTSSS